MNRKEISAALEEMAMLMDLQGENPFKVRAHANAARLLTTMDEGVFIGHLREESLDTVKGIGKNLSAKIRTFFDEGMLHELEALRESTPPGLLLMLQVPGLGVKRIQMVRAELGIESLAELEKACREHRVQVLPGFGEKTEEKLLLGIQRLRAHAGQFNLAQAWTAAERSRRHLEEANPALRLAVTGDLRRGAETVQEISLVFAGGQPPSLFGQFVALAGVDSRLAGTGDSAIFRLENGLPVRLQSCLPEQFGLAQFYATGSAAHITAMENLARQQGWRLTPAGLFAPGGLLPVPVPDEAILYAALDCVFIPPELREDSGEIDAARTGTLPALIEMSGLAGMLHVHSTYSDGTASLEAMARASRDRGYRYLAICDHSRTASYAGGLSMDAVNRQHGEIDVLNERLAPFRILKGIESEILKDGSLDYPDDFLERFELVVASIHSSFQMPEPEMTKRIIRAIRHPRVDIVGHPTGRLLLGRPGYQVDVAALIDEAAGSDTALELNANPHRLDLDWRNCRLAKARGVMIAINPDAHAVEGLDDIRYGVMVARRAWLERADVLNALPVEELLARRNRRPTRGTAR